jgi:hypothetical protein
MLFILGKLFDQLIGKTVSSVTRAAEAKLKRETVGKVEGKVRQAESTMRQRAMRGVDRSIDGALGKDDKK